MNVESLGWLQEWYLSHCDGDWEHNENIRIGTLDNPGWSVSINLEGTELENREFQVIEVNRSENDWLICFVAQRKFEGRGGPANLMEMIEVFKQFAKLDRV